MVSQISLHIHSELKNSGSAYRKEKIAGYLKTSSLDFIGVELPTIHRIVKTNTKKLNAEDMPKLMVDLWKIKKFETRVAAIDVMKEFAKNGPVDTAIEIADSWVNDADTWAITDPLCSPCIGSMILRDPMVENVLESWRTSENFWRRRCSFLPYLHLAHKTQYEPEFAIKILKVVTPHITDKEFFVGKAAGWVLRELSKREPVMVREYFVKNRTNMTKLVIREGMKKL